VLKKSSMGTLWNSVLGILGGGIGGQILGMLGAGGMAAGGTDIAGILGQVASGGVGGGVLLVIVGIIKNAMGR
jgi:uncharacterized membrane protein YeaQ/YmgE (transglycosylase-associated protein family)